jgi:hypothetical protein
LQTITKYTSTQKTIINCSPQAEQKTTFSPQGHRDHRG